ncbi:unnamed protein product [Penicillium olsonii]|uniref:Class I glutamine amidotransferase-like protein n=1 Tax=Penicillium olsonii TaxID=99116 RepID=A0A9W4HL64_PENOL|nr:unnamed protein product [Penicillium olsonii]CAG8074680.1 unnamed protein product [Penicillium olsonii]
MPHNFESSRAQVCAIPIYVELTFHHRKNIAHGYLLSRSPTPSAATNQNPHRQGFVFLFWPPSSTVIIHRNSDQVGACEVYIFLEYQPLTFEILSSPQHQVHMALHVAALDADVPCPAVYKERGLYSSIFRSLLQDAARRLNKTQEPHQNGLAVHVTAFDAVGGSLPPLETLRRSKTEPHAGPLGPIDAILITGSGFAAYENRPWVHQMQEFIQTVYNDYPDVKIFGSCFGHQIVAHALLSRGIEANSTYHTEHWPAGYEMGIHPITLDPEFTARFPPLARATPFRIQLIHGDQVVPTPAALAAGPVSLPAPWLNIGRSAQCAVQGLYNPGRVLTFQGHFEFDTWTNTETMQEFARRGSWPAEDVISYLEQIHRSAVPGEEDDDDAKAAAEAVLLFLAGDRVVSNGLMTPPLG